MLDRYLDQSNEQEDRPEIASLKRLATAVLLRAVEDARRSDKAREWFFSRATRPIFEFWSTVAGLDTEYLKQRVTTPAPSKPACPGLELRGKTWNLVVTHRGTRTRVMIGRGIEREEAVKAASIQRQAIKELCSEK